MATPSVAGETSTTFTGTSAPTITYTPSGVGNTIVVCVTTTAVRTISSVVDDMSTPTSYSAVVNQDQTASIFIWMGNNITDTDLTTWTVNLSSNATGSINIIEIANVSDTTPNDVSSSTTNTSVNPALVAAAGAIDTTTDVCTVMLFRPTTTATFTTPASYTRSGTGSSVFCAYRTSAGALTDEGSTNSTISLSAAKTGPGAIASFKADAAAAGGPFPHHTRRILEGGFTANNMKGGLV